LKQKKAPILSAGLSIKMENKIAIASDHAGFERKQAIIRHFINKGIPYDDLGCYQKESCDYPDFAHKIACAISRGYYALGITFCGTGQGISITANRYPKIRSAICWNAEIARLARQHNDANICSIPGRFVTDNEDYLQWRTPSAEDRQDFIRFYM
jgi:ribose 5-phosphate isomerase B